jgi:hypothetical protein
MDMEVVMRGLSLIVVVGLALVGVMGCGGAERAPRPEQIAAEKVQQALDAGEQLGEEGLDEVEVSMNGSEFDPPVQISQIPAGAWYCDMGTVHYAQLTRGDGLCRKCGMSLSQR